MNNIVTTKSGEMLAAVVAHKQLILNLFIEFSQLGLNEIREKLFKDLEKLKKFTGQTTSEINELVVSELVASGHLKEVDKFHQNPQYQITDSQEVLDNNTSFGTSDDVAVTKAMKVSNDKTILKQMIVDLFKDHELLTRTAITNKVRDQLVILEEETGLGRHSIIEEILPEMVKVKLLEETEVSNQSNPQYRRGTTPGVWPKPIAKEETQQPSKEFKMPEKVIDPKEFQRALEIIALQFVNAEIKEIEDEQHPTMIPGCERHHWYQSVRGMIMDHAFEFRLSKPLEGEFGVPGSVCKVQITKFVYPMEAWQAKAAMELLYNEGH